MLPEVKEYMAVKEAAERAYNNEYENISSSRPPRPLAGCGSAEYSAYQDRYREWQKDYRDRHNAKQEPYNSAMAVALTKLKESTKDPMLTWAFDNLMDGYWSYVEEIMPLVNKIVQKALADQAAPLKTAS